MYRTLRSTAIMLLLFGALAQPVQAGLAEDQYAVAAHHYSSARWNMAIEQFTRFLNEYPQHSRADAVVFFLAESLVQVGQYQAAHDRYAEYLERSPDGKYAHQSEFRVGESLYLDGKPNEARRYLLKFAERHPQDPLSAYAFPYLGEIALLSNEPDAARVAFETGLQRFPDGALAQECRFGLARALESLGDSDGALRFYEFLGESEQRTAISDDALLQMAILLYQQKRFPEAITALKRQRQQFPGSELAAHAAYWLGLSQTSTGQLRESAETLSTAAQRYRDHELAPAMVFAAGEAYRKLPDLEAAKRCYQKVLDLYPDSNWSDDSLQTLVQMQFDAGAFDTALELAARFSRQYGSSPLLTHVQQTTARIHLKRAEYTKAIRLLEPCLSRALASEADHSVEPVEPDEAPLPSAITQPEEQPADMAAIRYYLALALMGAERHEEALVQLDQLADVEEPRSLVSGVQVARSSALLALERYEEAISSLHLYLTNSPQGPDAEKCRAQLAVTCARLNRWSEVQRVLTQMQREHSDQTLYLSSLDYMAEAAYRANQRELAERMFRELSQEGNPEQYMAQGLAGLGWLDWTGAAAKQRSGHRFEQLLKRFPDSPMAAEAAMMRGQSLEQRDNLEGALAMYQLVLDRYADSKYVATATLAAARIYDALQRDAEAEPLLRQWLKEHPKSEQRPGALYQLAWVLVDLQRESEADEVFQEIRGQFPNCRYWSDATYRLAERAARSENYAEAEKLAAEIVAQSQDPQMVAYALYLRGQLAAASNRWKDVVEPLEQLLRDHPDSPHQLPAEYWLAEAWFRMREYEKAGELFDKLDEETSERDEQWVAMIPLRRAQVRAHRRAWVEAYEIASQIKSRFPEFSQQHEVDYLLGRYHASRAEFQDARDAYLRVIQSETGRGTETAAVAQWMIGETYFMQKQYNQAIEAYYRVESLYDFPRWTAAALLQAGKCHEMVGRWSEAVDLYARVVRDFDGTPVVGKAAQRLRVAEQRAELMKTR